MAIDRRALRRGIVLSLVLVLLGTDAAAAPPAVRAVDPAPIEYTYDANGRLSGVIDPATGAAAYRYDAAGNIVAIDRFDPGEIAVLAFTPISARVGGEVEIRGQGFSSTASQNTVSFDGMSAKSMPSTDAQKSSTTNSAT